jgi:hypothetical protein
MALFMSTGSLEIWNTVFVFILCWGSGDIQHVEVKSSDVFVVRAADTQCKTHLETRHDIGSDFVTELVSKNAL